MSRSRISLKHWRFLWQLCSMPTRNHPNRFILTTIEEAIGRDDYLAKGKIWKFRNKPAGCRISREASKGALSLLTKVHGCAGIVLQNISNRLKKLDSSRRCKPDLHLGLPAKTASASTKTSSRSNPSPARISRSPRANSWRSWRSCSLRS